MGSFSNYLEEALLKHVFGITEYTQPTIYVGLSTADPTDDASGLAEPSGNGYSRVAHASWDADGQDEGKYQVSNDGAIDMGTADGGSWGTITHVAIFDAESGGNMLAYGALDASKTVADGDSCEFADAELKVQLD
jgi:hypothetical protein